MGADLNGRLIGRDSASRHRLHVCGSAAVLAVTLGGVPAVQAVADEADAPAEHAGLEEIIVTAQKRRENLQSVPIDITAVTGDQVAAVGVQTTDDLPHLAPALVTSKGLGAGNYFFPFIRGVGSAVTSNGIENSVASYLDGVYQGDKLATLMDLEGIERVEVLKGPQGTLFGRNATGGAINIVTLAPTDSVAAHASASYGSYDQTSERAYVNGPIASGLSGNLSVVARQGGNYLYNIPTNQHFGATNNVTVRGKLRWQPIERLDATLSLQYTDFRSSDVGANLIPVPGSVPFALTLGIPGAATSPGGRVTNLNYIPVGNYIAKQAGLTVRYSLEQVDLVSISSYSNNSHLNLLDYDLTNIPVFGFATRTLYRASTQEFQLVSTSPGALQWMVGGYFIYMKEGFQPLDYLYSGPPTAASPGGTPVLDNSWANTRSEAVFAQSTYKFTPTTRLTAGLRYSWELKTLTGEQTLPAFGDLVVGGPIDLSKTFTKPTWRLSLDHDFSDEVLGYVSYNRGFKSGGWNSTLIAAQNPIPPEVLDAYEMGIKSRMLDSTLQINGSVYYYNYKDIQIQRVESANNIFGTANGKLYGVDFDATYRPIAPLQLNLGMNLEHTEYTKYDDASGVELNPDGSVTSPFVIANYTGAQLLNAPKVTFNVGATYTWEIGGGHTLDVASNYAHTSRYNQIPGNIAIVNSNGNLDASATWNPPGGHWYLSVWGKNLTDVQVVGAYASFFAASEQNIRPRSVGVTVGARL
jgi:iron complex outermembrane recepter protein